MSRRTLALVAALAVAGSAGACGKKKEPEVPAAGTPAAATPDVPVPQPVPSLPAPPPPKPEIRAAWTELDGLEKATKKGDEAARKEAQEKLVASAKAKVEQFLPLRDSLSKGDMVYVGLMQGMAGDAEGGITTLRLAVEKREETKYGANYHANLVQALIEANQPDGAAAEAEKMQALYEGKDLKTPLMNVGMAYRKEMKFDKSAQWLAAAFEAGNTNATKPWVNSLLMAGKQSEAVAAAKLGVEKGIPQQKEDMQVLVNVTEKIGSDVSDILHFDFAQGGEPDMKDKVIVMGFWNVSSKTFKWTLKLLDRIKRDYGDDVVCIAATTYYKKDAGTGKIDESMSPETERSFGLQLADQESWRGWMGYLPNEAAVKAWGVSALPHFTVTGRDRVLLFAHTMDPTGGGDTDIAILRKVLDSATGR